MMLKPCQAGSYGSTRKSTRSDCGCGVARGAYAAHLPGRRRQPQRVRMDGDGGHMDRQRHVDRQHIDLGVLAMSGEWDWLARARACAQTHGGMRSA